MFPINSLSKPRPYYSDIHSKARGFSVCSGLDVFMSIILCYGWWKTMLLYMGRKRSSRQQKLTKSYSILALVMNWANVRGKMRDCQATVVLGVKIC